MKPAPKNTSRHDPIQPARLRRREEALLCSGPAFVELLRAVLDKGVRARFRANGFSMSPFIRDGDVVTVFPLSAASTCLGDVLAFVHPQTGKLAVHRMIGKIGDSLIIKGDNVGEADGFVHRANVLGIVARVERNGKRVFLGMGPEKRAIALLNRGGLLIPLLCLIRRLVHPAIGRSVA